MAHYINRDRNHKPLYGDPFQAIYDWVGWTDRYPAISESVLKNPTSILPTRSQVETAAMGASAVGMAAMATGALPLAASLAVAGGITATALTLSNTQRTASLTLPTPKVPSGARPLALPAPVGWSDKEVDHEEEQKEAIKGGSPAWLAVSALALGALGVSGLTWKYQPDPGRTFKAAQKVADGVVDLRNLPSIILDKQYSKDNLNSVPSESGKTEIRVTSSAPPSDPVTPALGAVGDGARQMAANGALATAMAGAVAFEASQAGSAAARVVGNSVGMLLPQSTRHRLNGADELPSIAPPLPVIQLPPPDNRPTVTITQQQYLPAPPQPQSYRDPFGADTLPSNAPPKPVPHTPQQTQTYRNVNQSSATQSARHSKYYEPNVGYRPPIGDHGNVNLADVMRVIVSAPGAPGGDDPTATDFDWCCIGKAATAAAATALII